MARGPDLEGAQSMQTNKLISYYAFKCVFFFWGGGVDNCIIYFLIVENIRKRIDTPALFGCLPID